MGQPIVVTEKPSSRRGVVRFETNRALTGMGHERYVRDTETSAPPGAEDEAGTESGSQVTTSAGATAIGAAGDAVADADDEAIEDAAASPEALADPAEATEKTLDDAPDPDVDETRPTAANPASAGAPDATPAPPPSPVPAPEDTAAADGDADDRRG